LQNQGSFSYADGTTGTFVEVTLDTALGNAPIHGTDGSDTLVGSAGNDLLDGGDGVDTVNCAGANSSVIVNLAEGTATSSDGRDTLVSIENIIGSGFGDSLTGNSQDNVLSGGLGADTFHIGAGFGHDIINDYRGAQDGDVLQFSTDVFADVVAMLNAASNDGSGNVTITADADNSIILLGVTKADLEAHHDYLLFT
jgi:Ca2+-binding RTX toxin-like protein